MCLLRDQLMRISDPRHGLEHVFAESVGEAVDVVFFVRTRCIEEAEAAVRELCRQYLRALGDAMGGRLLRCHAASMADLALRWLPPS